jgi:hypothetical protein
MTVFGNALDKHPIEAWGIDRFVADRIAAQLGSRFDVRRLDYSRGVFASLEAARSPFSGDHKDYRYEIRDIARGIVGAQRCDLTIVVTKSGSPYSNTNQSVSGLGIVDASSLLFTHVLVFALWELRVYDGQTFAVLAHKRAPTEMQPLPTGLRGPHRKVDQSWWPAPAQLAHNGKLKQLIQELLEESLGAALAELFPSP